MEFSPADFENDVRFKIDNPLQHLDQDELSKRAESFAALVSKRSVDGTAIRVFKKLARWTSLTRQPRLATKPQGSLGDIDEKLTQLFRSAADIAQNPLKLDVLELSRNERMQFDPDQQVKFWDQPKTLRVTIVTLCFSAIVQGWIQSGGNGANQYWPVYLGILDENGYETLPHANWIFAGVNAVPFLAASIVGCWLSDPLQSAFLGRRGAIFISALLCFASLIGSACVSTWRQLLAARALVGVGMGMKASVTPILGAETSPSHLRGALVMNWQLFDALGIFLGFTANLVLLQIKNNDQLVWRLQFASACVPTLLLLTLIWTIPESPRWLLRQGRHQDAFKALCSLRETELQAATELFYANAQLQLEAEMQPSRQPSTKHSPDKGIADHIERVNDGKVLSDFQDAYARTNYFSRILQLFRNSRTRRATIAASVVMISQQLCGINLIALYSSTFFGDWSSPSSPTDPIAPAQRRYEMARASWLGWGVGLANFLFTFPAYFLIDRKGRRFLLLCTYPGMMLSLLAASLSSLKPDDSARIKVAVFIFIFVFFYSWGQGPVPFAYSSEVFPLINREVGMSFAVFVNLLGAGLLTLFIPLAEAKGKLGSTFNIRQASLLGIFVGFNVLAMMLIFFFVPETSGAAVRKKEEDNLSYMRLEELNHIFNVPILRHVSYQVRVVLPHAIKMTRWWVCCWFTRSLRRPLKPKKMWVWVGMKDQDSQDGKVVGTQRSSGLVDGRVLDKDIGVLTVSRRNTVHTLASEKDG